MPSSLARMFVPICTLSVMLFSRLESCDERADEATAVKSFEPTVPVYSGV